MIVAAGWSALAFKAAMSASSASTTIRSAFPFTLSPTVNCHDIFGLPQSYLRTSAHIDRYLACDSVSLCLGGCRVAAHSARTPICTKIEWADAGVMGITCYMVRPTRASCIGISQQWRAPSTDGNSVTPAQVTSTKVRTKSINLTTLAQRPRIRLKTTASGVPSGLPEREMSAFGTKRTLASVVIKSAFDPWQTSMSRSFAISQSHSAFPGSHGGQSSAFDSLQSRLTSASACSGVRP